MNLQRPIITYENVYLLKGNPKAHLLENNSGAAIQSVDYVQSISFSVDKSRTNLGAIGTKDFVDTSIRSAPDVLLTVDVLETFSDKSLFSGLISGDHNLDQNFYAVIGDKRGDGFEQDLDGRDLISFGNCFLSNVSLSQSTKGLLVSQYSYVGSNLEAQTIEESNPGVLGIGRDFTGKAPSINLTGDQSQDIKFSFPIAERLYTNSNTFLIPSKDTSVQIKAFREIETDAIFLVKPNNLQSFNMSLPINRKDIYSLGKKYPVKRKPLFPSLANINFSILVDNFETDNLHKNLKDFLNSDFSFDLNLGFANQSLDLGGPPNTFNLKIVGAKLKSSSFSSSIQSEMIAEISFEFNVNDISMTKSDDNPKLLQENDFALLLDGEAGNILLEV